MSGNPLYPLNASDSDFFDAVGGLTPRSHRIDPRRERAALADPNLANGCGTSGAGDGQIDRQLRDVPLPPDFIKRMHGVIDEA